MTGFIIRTKDDQIIRFRFYSETSLTTEAFEKSLPFSRTFFHARVSGEEIWTDNAPGLDIIQENSSVFTEPGEIAIAPVKPSRNRITKCMGIFYGEGKLLDSANIFGKVIDEDLPLLKKLGDEVWRLGAQDLRFERINSSVH